MKNFRVLASVLAVIAFLGTSIQAIAVDNTSKDELSISVQQQDAQWFKLIVANLGNQTATISISNSGKSIIYETTVNNASSYGNLFKYRNLPKGSYTITVDLNNASFTLPLKVKDNNIEVNGTIQKNIKPTLNIVNNILSVNVADGTHEKVKVLIFDNYFDKIYSDKNKVNATFRKNYNLKNLPSGEYAIKVRVGKQDYYKYITIN